MPTTIRCEICQEEIEPGYASVIRHLEMQHHWSEDQAIAYISSLLCEQGAPDILDLALPSPLKKKGDTR